MISFKKILVATDFSDTSMMAFPFAETIARKYEAQIDFLHIVPTLRYFSESMASFDLPYDLEDELYPKVQQESKHRLQKLMDGYLKEEHKGEAIVHVGPKPSTGITDHARHGDYDLVVIASRGAGETHLLRGSVTEKVIRHSEVPVFAITRRSSAEDIRRIIFPTDGSQRSLAAFPLAVSLATVYEADITLFHVVELYGSAFDIDQRPTPDKTEAESIYENLMKQLKQFLAVAAGEAGSLQRGDAPFGDTLVVQEGASSSTVALKTEVRRGITAHQEIEEYAADHSDVVVMTTHGHTGLARFFLGSTAERISQHLDKPLLTVRPPEEELEE